MTSTVQASTVHASTVQAYAQPIVEQLRRLGEAAQPVDGAIEANETGLHVVQAKLADLHIQHTAATRTVMASWEGSGAGEANSRAATLHGRMGAIADDASTALGALRDAAGQVRAGRTEIQSLVDEFSGWAAGQVSIMQQAPEVVRPSIGAGIWARANEYAGRAGDVVGRVDGELAGLAGTLRELAGGSSAGLDALGGPLTEAAAPTPATTAPAGAPSTVLASLASPPELGTAGGAAPPGTGSGGPGAGFSGGGGGGGGGTGGGIAVRPNLPMVQPIPPGAGVQLQVPGGETAEAPNEIAANAVRYALTQLGVPYVWAAASPGQGFDCSGLTWWAYGMAGLELPRHSAAQAVGAMAPPDQLMPGDLIVWNGHVAMVVGAGMLVEAGDPVQTGPLRTGNSGMQFLGFYRPTG